MKHSYYLFAIFLAACWHPTFAQSSRELAEARTVYQQANATPAGRALRSSVAKQSTGFLGDGTFQYGALRTYDGRYRPVPGLRYHAALHLLEAQDSINTDSTHLWPVGSLRGFDLGEAGGTGDAALRRFRARLVKEGSGGTRREYVEVLTATDAGPLLLAWLYTASSESSSGGRKSIVPVLMVGPGTATAEPLRPFSPSQSDVLRLFGARSDEVRSFAAGQRLHYDQPTEIARMFDYYNRVAVVK